MSLSTLPKRSWRRRRISPSTLSKRSQRSRNPYKKGGCQTMNPQKMNLPLKMNLNHQKMVQQRPSTSFLLLSDICIREDQILLA